MSYRTQVVSVRKGLNEAVVDRTPAESGGGLGGARAVMLLAVAAAVVGLVAAFGQGRDRTANVAAVEAVGRNTTSMYVAEWPPAGGFAGNTVWVLPSYRGQFDVDANGRPFVEFDSSTGVLIGSASSSGLEGLAIVPPGLLAAPAELRISPASTALALVALHPDVSTADARTLSARLVAALSSSSFAALSDRVDGTPLADWDHDDRVLLSEVVSDSLYTRHTFPCANPEPTGGELGNISVCSGSTELLNAANRSEVVAGTDGEPCAIVPGASGATTEQGLDALRRLIGSGAVQPVADVAVFPGSVLAPCGDNPIVVRNDLTHRATSFSDVSVALGRLLGAGGDIGPPVEFNDDLTAMLTAPDLGTMAASPTAAERLRTGVALLGSPDLMAALGLEPLTGDAPTRLAELTSLLEGLYQ